jgi:pilus assembly protein TadC
VLDASDLGGRWRDELVVVGDRLALPDLHRLLGALARTDSLGSSLAEEIGHLASDVREVRRAAAAQRARTAPVKMLFPLLIGMIWDNASPANALANRSQWDSRSTVPSEDHPDVLAGESRDT